MLKIIVLSIAAAGLLAVSTGAALAQNQAPQRGPGGGPGMQQGRMFEMLDQDGDGALSREEFIEGERPGRMSGSEWAHQNREQMFDQLDQDGDGQISFAEMSNMAPRRR
jgi:hypothetical protein